MSFNAQVEIPEWFKLASVNASFSSKEVMELFGFKSSGGLFTSVKNGNFPKCDFEYHGPKYGTKMFWKKQTLLKEIKRRNEKGLPT